MHNEWIPVVYAAEVDEDTGQCPQCGGEYATCPCPGPTMADEYEYRVTDHRLEARRKVA